MSDGDQPDTFRPQPQPAENQASGHDAEREGEGKGHRGHAVDVLDPRELERYMPKPPDDRGDYHSAPGAHPIRESREQPCPPSDFLEKSQEGHDCQASRGIERDVSHKSLDRERTPSTGRRRVVQTVGQGR
jgi:hypothetical protein